MKLNWVDWGIIIFSCISIAYSCMRGGIRSTLALLTWIISIYLAVNFHSGVALWLARIIQSEWIRNTIAITGLMIASLLTGWLGSKFLVPKLKDLDFLGMDRGLGFALGLGRALLVLILLIQGVKLAGFDREPVYQKSILVAKIQPLGAWASRRMLVLILGNDIKEEKRLVSHVRYSRYHGEIRGKPDVV